MTIEVVICLSYDYSCLNVDPDHKIIASLSFPLKTPGYNPEEHLVIGGIDKKILVHIRFHMQIQPQLLPNGRYHETPIKKKLIRE